MLAARPAEGDAGDDGHGGGAAASSRSKQLGGEHLGAPGIPTQPPVESTTAIAGGVLAGQRRTVAV